MCTCQGGAEDDQSDWGLVQPEGTEPFLSTLRGAEAHDEEDEPGNEKESFETV